MLQFFKYTLATVVGLFLFGILSVFILIGIASSMGKKSAVDVKAKTVLVLDFKGEVLERAADNPFAKLQGNDNSAKRHQQ